MANLKIKTNEFEIFANGKLVSKAKGWDKFEEDYNNIINDYRSKGYSIVESMKGSHGYTVMSNAAIGDAVFVAYRRWFGFRDKNNRKIYDDDILGSNVNGRVYIDQHYDREGEYYYRIVPNESNRFFDTDIVDMDFINYLDIVVKKKVFDFTI